MELTEAINTFAVRLYEWSQRDFLREMEAGCPMLSLIAQNYPSVGGFVSWNKMLSTSDRARVAKAFTLRTQPNAARLKIEVTSDETRKWGELFYEHESNFLHNVFYMATADRSASSYRALDVDSLLDKIVALLLGRQEKVTRNRSGVRWVRKNGDWKTLTEFKFERRRERLSFNSQFIRKDGGLIIESGFGPYPRDLLSLYGIYNSTVVMVPSQADSEPMAKAMTKIAIYFVSHAEPFLEGLGIDD